jgi:hypothetical protein
MLLSSTGDSRSKSEKSPVSYGHAAMVEQEPALLSRIDTNEVVEDIWR